MWRRVSGIVVHGLTGGGAAAALGFMGQLVIQPTGLFGAAALTNAALNGAAFGAVAGLLAGWWRCRPIGSAMVFLVVGLFEASLVLVLHAARAATERGQLEFATVLCVAVAVVCRAVAGYLSPTLVSRLGPTPPEDHDPMTTPTVKLAHRH